MSFFTLSTGELATGAADKAHWTVYPIIPDQSQVLAQLLNIEKKQGKVAYYSIQWEVTKGDYTGVKITQTLFPWSSNESAADRAKQMLMRIYKCVNVPAPQLEPATHELYQLHGRVCGVKVKEKVYIDKNNIDREANDIIEVHPAKGFVESIGTKLPFTPRTHAQGHTRNTTDERNPPFDDSDIPNF